MSPDRAARATGVRRPPQAPLAPHAPHAPGGRRPAWRHAVAGVRLVAGVALASILAGCTPPMPEPGVVLQDESRITGRVDVVGAEPLTQVMIRPQDGPALRVIGDNARLMERTAGATVEAIGVVEDEDATLDVRTFTVKEVDGMAAIDGVLFRDGQGFGLVDGAGETHRMDTPPAALQRLVGARVWITGALDAPQAWGVIIPAP